MPRRPAWLQKLFDNIRVAIEADSPDILLGWTYEPPDKRTIAPHWSMILFPTRIELRGGRYDGKIVRPRIHVCVSHLMEVFDTLPHVDWRVPPRYAGFTDAPHLVLSGMIKRKPLVLSVFDRAPRDHEVRTLYDTRTGECRLTEDSHAD
jgi:hypothetical protein